MAKAHPRLTAVNVVHHLIPGDGRQSAIDKRPVAGAVQVTTLGAAGDVQMDKKHHGGPDKAVYAYSTEAAQEWAERLDRSVPPGTFGENLTIAGLDVDSALIGERWQVGARDTGVLLEVRMPRTSCENLSIKMGLPGFDLDFAKAGHVGAYLKVLGEGQVTAGDPVEVVHRPAHEVTVRLLMRGATAAQMQGMLDAGIDLAPSVRRKAQRRVRRPARRQPAPDSGDVA